MKEFKGTKGPFTAQEDVESMATSVVMSEFGDILCVVGSYMTSTEEDYANADLFAASPLLLSALHHLVEVYDDPTGKQWTTTSKREALDKAREAIKLALGE